MTDDWIPAWTGPDCDVFVAMIRREVAGPETLSYTPEAGKFFEFLRFRVGNAGPGLATISVGFAGRKPLLSRIHGVNDHSAWPGMPFDMSKITVRDDQALVIGIEPAGGGTAVVHMDFWVRVATADGVIGRVPL